MKLGEVFEMLVDPDCGVEFVAYDGSRAGDPDSDIRVVVKSPKAVGAFMSAPGQLGIARAYVHGDLDIEGDVYEAFARLYTNHRMPSKRESLALLRNLGPHALKRVPPPPEEVKLGGRLHGRRRDADAISHHYDVSNTFYEWLLGPTMAYTCAVYPKIDSTLEEAQDEKFDLVCRKLGLRSGMKLLDVGCGWGGMTRHAAKHYGVEVIGVTLSKQQALWGQQMLEREGLTGTAQIRAGDYRDVPETGFDAVSSIGLTEHIGRDQYDNYFTYLRGKLNHGARLLNHCITRTDAKARTKTSRGFINRYIFPDGELVHVGHLIDRMEHQNLEVRHEENLREHYAMTLRDWSRNLDDNWDKSVAEIGLRKARVWRLYLNASRWGFASNIIQLHQVLAVHTAPDGSSEMPLRPDW
jgi:cyclopropane-fatty-acyl-phospholipid synthase